MNPSNGCRNMHRPPWVSPSGVFIYWCYWLRISRPINRHRGIMWIWSGFKASCHERAKGPVPKWSHQSFVHVQPQANVWCKSSLRISGRCGDRGCMGQHGYGISAGIQPIASHPENTLPCFLTQEVS